jgi:dTDP-4-dehydrorhamnose 3,5-epimerase
MKVIKTHLPEVIVIEPQVFADERGHFFESFHQAKFSARGIDTAFVQSNVSRSIKGVLRGLHYQWPNPQAKLVGVLEGEIYDVAVDIRRGSPTFGQWTSAVLSADNHRLLWIPEGYAHGFCVVSDFATVNYQCTTLYDHEADANILWNDAELGIDWPIHEALLSAKDAKAPLLGDVPANRLPLFTL